MFFLKNHVKIGFLVSENIKIDILHVFMLSSEKDMHKRKFSISMAAILDFFNLNLLSIQKKIGTLIFSILIVFWRRIKL